VIQQDSVPHLALLLDVLHPVWKLGRILFIGVEVVLPNFFFFISPGQKSILSEATAFGKTVV
jgi:hypothetical protein